MSGPDGFGEFYRWLKQVKEHHRKYPNDIEEPMQMEFLKLDEERVNPPEELQSESVAYKVGKHYHEPLILGPAVHTLRAFQLVKR